MIPRRRFLETGLASLATVGLIEALCRADAVPATIEPILAGWLRDLHARCGDLRGGAIPATEWQTEMTRLLERVPLPELLKLVDLERLLARTELPDDRATTRDPVFPTLEGIPERTSYIRRVFMLAQGRAIVPHGHRNMVSAHLVLHGSLRVRHFDRVTDEPEHLVLRPTIDRESTPGAATAVSDHKDNVHWLVATSRTAATFDVIVTDLDPSRPTEFMDFVDPRRGERLADGTIRAPRLGGDEVFRRYGKTGV